MADETISKAKFAAIIGVSKARVSQLVGRGLPVRGDGQLNKSEALNWVKRFTSAGKRGEKSVFAVAVRATSAPTAAADRGTPEHFDFAWDIADQFDRGATVAAMAGAYEAPALAALAAIEAGAPPQVAYAIYQTMIGAASEQVTDRLIAMECEPFCSNRDAPVWAREGLLRVNWQVIADKAGVPYDAEAWEAYAKGTARAAEGRI